MIVVVVPVARHPVVNTVVGEQAMPEEPGPAPNILWELVRAMLVAIGSQNTVTIETMFRAQDVDAVGIRGLDDDMDDVGLGVDDGINDEADLDVVVRLGFVMDADLDEADEDLDVVEALDVFEVLVVVAALVFVALVVVLGLVVVVALVVVLDVVEDFLSLSLSLPLPFPLPKFLCFPLSLPLPLLPSVSMFPSDPFTSGGMLV